jgi:hypothetical protein
MFDTFVTKIPGANRLATVKDLIWPENILLNAGN